MSFAAILKMTGILYQVCTWLLWELCMQHCLLHYDSYWLLDTDSQTPSNVWRTPIEDILSVVKKLCLRNNEIQ